MAWASFVVLVTLIGQIITFIDAGYTGSESLIDGFRPPSVPLVVVDPYFRFVTRQVPGLPRYALFV